MATGNLQQILQEIYQERGRLTAHDVLEEARVPGHPLHSRFEWDDSVAAERYRLDQARQLIREVKITFVPRGATEPESVRGYFSVPSPEGRAYQPTEEIANNPLMLKMLLNDMSRDWNRMRERYGHLVEFTDMVRRHLDAA
jgi:hypothetical protein